MKKQIYENLYFFSLVLTLLIAPSLRAEEIDPFESIEYLKLNNGLGVYFAPSEETNLTSIRVEVDVGWEAEKKGNWGVSHLLEHVLFRDKGLRDEMTYLQLIKEAGGSANGTTQRRLTAYFGTIPSAKGEWLMDNFAKMLIVEKIDAEYVRKEKATVELEIGQPGPMTLVLGRHPKEFLMPSYLKQKGFWKKEFDLDTENRFTETEEQFSNRMLTAEQVWKHYKSFYHPTNMRIYVAGKFNRDQMLQHIQSTFGQMAPTGGLKLLPAKKPKLNGRPYVVESLGQEISSVALGTKAVGLSIQESDVLSSYANYLAHVLMKEVRNKKGQTYTARKEDSIYGTYGYSGVSFETPKDNLSENIKIAQDIINRQAINGQMTKEEVEEAKKLFLSTYTLNGREVGQLMSNAITYRSIQEDYGHFSSPYKALKETTPEQYNAILKKYYVPENKYQVINRAPYLFAYDYILFCGVVAILTFALLRRGLTKKFKHDKVRWVRKIQYPPLKMLECAALMAGVVAFVHACFVADLFWQTVPGLEANLFTKIYLGGAITVALLIFSLLLPLCALPKKMMVVEDQLLIKSVTYYSKSIPLQEIASLEKTNVYLYPFPLSKWVMKVGPRLHYFSLKFWKPGLQVNLKNGKSYVFSVESAEEVIKELDQFLPKEEKAELGMAIPLAC